MTKVSMTINGVLCEADVEDRRLLADVIREDFGLTGTKLGCSHGVCGSCTVHVDGEPVRSCLSFAVQADGCAIRTVEGLAAAGASEELHPVQAAFWEAHGLQCGFCTPGFLIDGREARRERRAHRRILGARSHQRQHLPLHGIRLDRQRRRRRRTGDARRRPRPRVMSGGTEQVPDFARKRWVGQALKRVEDPKMITGAARYVGDLAPAGTLEAAFLRSPYPHALVRSIDTSAAEKAPGVVAVLTAADLADTVPLADLIDIEGSAKTPRSALAGTKVRFVGEPVAMVVAADRYLAEDALEHIDVDWEPLPAVASIEQAEAGGAPALHDDIEGNCYYRSATDTGAADDAFANAAHVVRRRLHLGRIASSAMEARGILRVARPHDRRAHLLDLEPGAVPAALPPVARARPAREPDPRDRAGRRRRVRPQGLHLPRGRVRGRRRTAAAPPGALDRGPQREPHRRRARQGAGGRARTGRRRGRQAARRPRALHRRHRRLLVLRTRRLHRLRPGGPVAPRPVRHRRVRGRDRRHPHQQGPDRAVPRRRLHRLADGPRDPARRARPRSRHRPDRAATAQHDRRRAADLGDRDDVRRRQLRSVARPGARADRVRLLPRDAGARTRGTAGCSASA